MSVSFNDVSGYIIILSFYALNCIFFSANETALLSHNNQSNFSACLKKSVKLQKNERYLLQLFKNQLNVLNPKLQVVLEEKQRDRQEKTDRLAG